jgi:hypothetical protein
MTCFRYNEAKLCFTTSPSYARSHNLLGWAADIQIDGYDPRTVANRLKDDWAGGLGDSEAFTHLDLRHLMGISSAYWDYGFA